MARNVSKTLYVFILHWYHGKNVNSFGAFQYCFEIAGIITVALKSRNEQQRAALSDTVTSTHMPPSYYTPDHDHPQTNDR